MALQLLPGWLRMPLTRRWWAHRQSSLRDRCLEADDFVWRVEGDGTPDGSASSQPLTLVGGLDISFFSDGGNPNDDRACVALIVCRLGASSSEDMTVVWKDFQFVRMTEPYIAGFLAFREAPHYCEMLRRLKDQRPDLYPDVVLVDGNGLLHPRGFGVASHVGVLADTCTIGVAKNLHMVDGLDRDSVKDRCATAAAGVHVPLIGQSGRTLGAALVPQPRKSLVPKRSTVAPKNPIFVSVGHRISLETSVQVVRRCVEGARVPEPIRLADTLSRQEVRTVREKEDLLPRHLRGVTDPRSLAGSLAFASLALGIAGVVLWRRRGAGALRL